MSGSTLAGERATRALPSKASETGKALSQHGAQPHAQHSTYGAQPHVQCAEEKIRVAGTTRATPCFPPALRAQPRQCRGPGAQPHLIVRRVHCTRKASRRAPCSSSSSAAADLGSQHAAHSARTARAPMTRNYKNAAMSADKSVYHLPPCRRTWMPARSKHYSGGTVVNRIATMPVRVSLVQCLKTDGSTCFFRTRAHARSCLPECRPIVEQVLGSLVPQHPRA